MRKMKSISFCGIRDCLSHQQKKDMSRKNRQKVGTTESSPGMAKALQELLGNETGFPTGLLLN